MSRLFPVLAPRVSLALLLLRIVVAASFIIHGAPKLGHPFSWASGPGYPPGIPAWLQLVVCIAENAGGWCILAGFLTPLWAFLQACDMIGAGFWLKAGLLGLPYVGPRNFEIESHLFVAALVLLLCGPGTYAVDAVLFRARGRLSPGRYATG